MTRRISDDTSGRGFGGRPERWPGPLGFSAEDVFIVNMNEHEALRCLKILSSPSPVYGLGGVYNFALEVDAPQTPVLRKSSAPRHRHGLKGIGHLPVVERTSSGPNAEIE